MKFSVRVQYGLQALLELALRYESGPVQIRDIAREQKVPIRYLEQILLVLKRRGLVQSVRGKLGGYVLGSHPSDISLLSVIEGVEGPIEIANIKMKKSPVLFETFEKIEKGMREELSKLTLEDLMFKKRQKERAYIYNI